MQVTKAVVTTSALEVLNETGTVSLDSAAERVGLTKPGLMHHFPTKRALMLGLVDRVIDEWLERLPDAAVDPVERMRAYARFALQQEFGPTDLIFLADPRLRDSLTKRWVERMADFVHLPDDLPTGVRTTLLAIRLIADGVWLAGATDAFYPTLAERARLRELIDTMLEAST